MSEVQNLGDGHFIASTTEDDIREQVNGIAARWGLLESRAEGGLEELYLRAVREGASEDTASAPAPADSAGTPEPSTPAAEAGANNEEGSS